MTDDREQLHQTLEQLHEQLEETDQLDPELADQLKQTMDDIRTTLEKQGQIDDHHSLTERLHESARHFEDSHPILSGTLGRLIDALGQMGI